jgi:hypothetical protein
MSTTDSLKARYAALSNGLNPAPAPTDPYVLTSVLASNLNNKLDKNGGILSGPLVLPAIMSSGGVQPVVNLFSNPPDNGVYFSGSGAKYSYTPWTGGNGTDLIRAAHYIRFKSQVGIEIGETAAAIDAYFNSGYAANWSTSSNISIGDQIISSGNVYVAIQSGVTSNSGTGPAGTGTSISDGSVLWKYVIAFNAAGNNKVGLSETYAVGPNSGQAWGGARNIIALPGVRAAHISNTEIDFGNLNATADGVLANYFGIFRFGFTRYPITSWDVFSTPITTPEIGTPPSWAPNTPYNLPTTGAPVRKNGTNYYVLVKAGVSAASGGPTGTGSNIIDGTAQWDWYNPSFTGTITGGASLYGILFQGQNNIVRDTINIATGSLVAIRGDGAGNFANGFIVDQSTAPVSFQSQGKKSYAAFSDLSTTPFGVKLEGIYSGAALKYQDTLIGRWGGDSTYGALSVNGTLGTGSLNGFFGSSADPNLYLNAQANHIFRIGGSQVAALNAARLSIQGRYNSPLFTPASSTAAGTVGDFAADTSYIYVCTANNTWKRSSLTSF